MSIALVSRGSQYSLGLAHPLFPFGIGFELPDISTSAVAVTALPLKGSFFSSPWQSINVSKNKLESECNEIEKAQKEAKEKAEREREEQEAKEVKRLSEYYYNKYRQTEAYKEGVARAREAYNRWQRMLNWEFILRTKYNDHRTICSPTHSGVRCTRYSSRFDAY